MGLVRMHFRRVLKPRPVSGRIHPILHVMNGLRHGVSSLEIHPNRVLAQDFGRFLDLLRVQRGTEEQALEPVLSSATLGQPLKKLHHSLPTLLLLHQAIRLVQDEELHPAELQLAALDKVQHSGRSAHHQIAAALQVFDHVLWADASDDGAAGHAWEGQGGAELCHDFRRLLRQVTRRLQYQSHRSLLWAFSSSSTTGCRRCDCCGRCGFALRRLPDRRVTLRRVPQLLRDERAPKLCVLHAEGREEVISRNLLRNLERFSENLAILREPDRAAGLARRAAAQIDRAPNHISLAVLLSIVFEATAARLLRSASVSESQVASAELQISSERARPAHAAEALIPHHNLVVVPPTVHSLGGSAA
mmetsp:Transcript_11070/g.23147  ORF Transcript_11070/g.23147 Transcript_11070/m.23147 type:complete len:361 (-) Transcript_11070:95-1177(-)